jgi:hypothetical protein
MAKKLDNLTNKYNQLFKDKETSAKNHFVILSETKDFEFPVVMRFTGRYAPSE